MDYSEKLTRIIRDNDIKEVTVVRMEVPCCGGLENAAKRALQAIALHGGKCAGQRTAVDAQVVGQLLAVKGQLKLQAALLHGQRGKVGCHPLPDGLGGSVQAAAGQIRCV